MVCADALSAIARLVAAVSGVGPVHINNGEIDPIPVGARLARDGALKTAKSIAGKPCSYRDCGVQANTSLADVALMPFIRQFAHVDREWFAQTPYPRLQDWLQQFLASGLFTSIMAK